MEGRWINTTAELSDRCAGKKKKMRRMHTEPEKRGDTRVLLTRPTRRLMRVEPPSNPAQTCRPPSLSPVRPQAAELVRASAYDAQGVRRGAPRAERAPKKILRVVEG